MRRIVLFGLILGLLAGGSGCGVCGWPACGPGSPGTICDPTHCAAGGHECGSSCGTACGLCSSKAYPGPLSCLMYLCNYGTYKGPVCGDVYWGDWHGDPPDCCDPCDRHGNYTGVQTGGSGCGGGCSGGCVDCEVGCDVGCDAGCDTCAHKSPSVPAVAHTQRVARSHGTARR